MNDTRQESESAASSLPQSCLHLYTPSLHLHTLSLQLTYAPLEVLGHSNVCTLCCQVGSRLPLRAVLGGRDGGMDVS